MELIHGLHNWKPQYRGCVLTIGKFDGVHLGHQALLERTREAAAEHGVPALVMTFDPTPGEYFSRVGKAPRIGTLRDNLSALDELGVHRLLLLRFNADFASTTPEDFVERLMLRELGVRAIVVGDDFRFGKGRCGDESLLREKAQGGRFDVHPCSSVMVDGLRVSSTAIREALANADLDIAERLLGRRYRISGRVKRGLQLGRKLGVPTANIHLTRPMALRLGVYAVRARVDQQWFDGVANLGVRPTLGLTRCLLETHLFAPPESLPNPLYGRPLSVEFHAFMRPELKFASLEALSAQMHRDIDDAKALLTHS